MAHFQPPPPVEEGKGWFGRASTAAPTPHPEMHQEAPASAADVASAHQRQGEEVSQPIPIEGTKLVATLRNVFISTPNPLAAPQHPADPIIVEHDSPAASVSSSQASLDKMCKDKVKSAGRRKAGKTEDYLNTLEISRPEDRGEKEAVVVLHGYAAALG
jgi:cardiolipin-specific phospholipase